MNEESRLREAAHGETVRGVRGDRLEGGELPAPLVHLREGHARVDDGEPLSVSIREWAYKNPVRHGKHGRVQPNPQRANQDRGDRRPSIVKQTTTGENEFGEHRARLREESG